MFVPIVAVLIADANPERLVPAPPHIVVEVETDKSVYKRGELPGLRLLVKNEGSDAQTVSVLSAESPEREAWLRITDPDGSTRTCYDIGGPFTVSGMYRKMAPGTEIDLPDSGFRSIANWGCAIRVGKSEIQATRNFKDPITGAFYRVDSPKIAIEMIGE